ncbi:hypothetical protein GCM10023314_07130 [Algibacter agarivorans]|uniref:GIY-YIG domain-containing protein n=1 Tax=Algibacter agarivorans TaxID=1109741 RepID=A0ABP9GJ08_9FLAO
MYIGHTEDLKRRIEQHKKGNGAVYTKKYNVTELIYFEDFINSSLSRKREKQLKNWHKEWKWSLT